jgi:Tfp pilus assembly protein PilN
LTQINLLPPERIKAKRTRAPSEKSFLWLVITVPVVVLLLMIVWYFATGSSLSSKQKALDQANKDLADYQAKNASLQQYKARQDQITQIESTVVKALSGRVYWARILNNIAIMCPTNIWLDTLNGTSTSTSGTVAMTGFATQCPNRLLGGFFPGVLDYHPDFRPIAGWLERMSQIEQFSRVWLASAEPTFVGSLPTSFTDANIYPDTIVTLPPEWVISVPPKNVVLPTAAWTIKFSSTATLERKKAAIGTAVTATPTPAAAAPSESAPGGTQ